MPVLSEHTHTCPVHQVWLCIRSGCAGKHALLLTLSACLASLQAESAARRQSEMDKKLRERAQQVDEGAIEEVRARVVGGEGGFCVCFACPLSAPHHLVEGVLSVEQE